MYLNPCYRGEAKGYNVGSVGVPTTSAQICLASSILMALTMYLMSVNCKVNFLILPVSILLSTCRVFYGLINPHYICDYYFYYTYGEMKLTDTGFPRSPKFTVAENLIQLKFSRPNMSICFYGYSLILAMPMYCK